MQYLTVFLLLFTALPEQTRFNDATDLFSQHYTETIFAGSFTNGESLPINGFSSIFKHPIGGRDSLVIGDTPGETLFVSGAYNIPMDIYIIGDGVMLVRNADLSIKGNIMVLNKGIFDCDSSDVHFLQDYIYEFGMVVADSSELIMKNSITTFNRFPIGLVTLGNAHLLWENLDNKDWTTASVFGSSVDSLVNVSIAGEWLLSDQCYTSFKDTDTLLVWYFFPDSSVVDFTFPDGDTVNGFLFDSTLSNVSGIDYHTEIDNCHGVMWGMFPLCGSDVTITDSELRTTGLMFNADSSSVSGLVNGLTYNDFMLPLQDRIYHLINTSVNTWSFYPADTSYLEISNSIFGECVGMGNTEYLIQNAFCDGSGGHIETTDNTVGMIFLSSLMCDVITNGHSVLVIGYSSILLGNIWATGSSIMLLINANIPNIPQALDTSIVFIDAVTGPSTANTYEIIPVTGSATVLSGPFQPGGFDYYELFYRAVGESLWVQFDSSYHTPVYNGTLGYWNTDGFEPNYYELRSLLIDTYGDSIEALKQVNLLPGGIKEESVSEKDRECPFSLAVNRKTIDFKNYSRKGTVSLYDASGRCIRSKPIKTNETIRWSLRRSGIYFIRLENGISSFVKKAILF